MRPGKKNRTLPVEGRGFTLVEVLVTLTIASFVTVVAMSSLKTMSTTSARIQTHSDQAAELRFAAARLRRDLNNLYRDKEARRQKFVATLEPSGSEDQLFLTFYCLSRSKARPAEPEGDVYEVEYFLQQTEQRSALMRRHQPNPHAEDRGQGQGEGNRDGERGGILSVMADGIGLFKARFHDGQEWQEYWGEDTETLPEMVEVTIGLVVDPEKPPLLETILVSLKRGPGQTDSGFEAGGGLNRGGAGNRGGGSNNASSGNDRGGAR